MSQPTSDFALELVHTKNLYTEKDLIDSILSYTTSNNINIRTTKKGIAKPYTKPAVKKLLTPEIKILLNENQKIQYSNLILEDIKNLRIKRPLASQATIIKSLTNKK